MEVWSEHVRPPFGATFYDACVYPSKCKLWSIEVYVYPFESADISMHFDLIFHIFNTAQQKCGKTFKVGELTSPPPAGVRTRNDAERTLTEQYSNRSDVTVIKFKVGGSASSGYGRIYPTVKYLQSGNKQLGAAASMVPRWLRAYCYAKRNWYMDVSNCLPTIESQLGSAFNIAYPDGMLGMRGRVCELLKDAGVDSSEARTLGKAIVLRVMYGAEFGKNGSIAEILREVAHPKILQNVEVVIGDMPAQLAAARDQLMQRMTADFVKATGSSAANDEKKRRNRCIALLLQSIERVLICEIVPDILRDEGRTVTGYIHDGLLFERRHDEKFPNDLVGRVSKRLLERSGFKLELAQEELAVPCQDLWRADASLSPLAGSGSPFPHVSKDVPVGYPLDVLNQVAIAGELAGVDGQGVRAFADRITHKLKRGHEEFDENCEGTSQWLELRGDGSRHVLCEACGDGTCSLHPRPAKRRRVDKSNLPWLQTFLKANQAIIGNNITFNINVNDASETPCALDSNHREYFEDRFAFIQRENVYYEFASGAKYKTIDFVQGNKDRMSIDAKGNKQNSAQLWVHDENQKMFKELVYMPGKPEIVTNPDPLGKPFYNTWRSAGALPDARGCCDLFYELLLHMCHDDTGVRDYMLDLFAWKVQNVDSKPDVCLQLISKEQGTGKSFLLGCLGKACFGHRAESAHGSFNVVDGMKKDECFGKFNGHLTNLDVVLVEELDNLKKQNSKRTYETMKQLITGDFVNERKMHVGYASVRNYALWMLTSNNGYAIRLDAGDRRHIIVHASNWLLMQGDDKGKSFIERVVSQLENDGGYGRLHHDLKNRPLDKDHRSDSRTFRPSDFESLPAMMVEWRAEAMQSDTSESEEAVNNFFVNLSKTAWSEDDMRSCLKSQERVSSGFLFELSKTDERGILSRTPHSVRKEIMAKYPAIEAPSIQEVRNLLVRYGFMPSQRWVSTKNQRVYFGFRDKWSEEFGP